MSYALPVIVLLTQFNSVCTSALSIGDWHLAVSESGQAATLNTHAGPYDLENVNTCFHDKFSDIVAQDADNWVSIDEWKTFGLGLETVPNIPVDVNSADIMRWESPVADLTINEGGVEKQITATIGFGHGVASLKCGDCFLIETSGTSIPGNSWIHNNADYTDLLAHDKLTRYAVIRTVDIATWSLEISDPSLYYLLPLDGRIDHSTQPKYQSVDCKAVMSAVVLATPTTTTTATNAATTSTTSSTTMAITTTATATATTTASTTTITTMDITTTLPFTTTMSTTHGGGSCTGQPCDSAWHTSAHCRSKWGSCGATNGHCNAESLWCGSDAVGCSCAGITASTTTTTTVITAATTSTTISATVDITTTLPLTTTMTTAHGGGSCTGQPCDSAWHTSAHCRSKWGSCGATNGHCNAESLWCGSGAAGCSCGGKSGRRLRGGEAPVVV